MTAAQTVPVVELRELRWQDLAAVHRIETDAFEHDPWSEASFWAELAARPRRDYVVLQERPADGGDPAVIGYAGLDLAGEVADVMTIAVDPARRGRGHGQVLLRHLLERAADAGASRVLLEVRADNEPALALYARHGFAEVHRRRGYYSPGAVDALVMSRKVTDRG